MDKILKVVMILLLSGILGLLVAIYLKIPNAIPTVGDLIATEGKEKQQEAIMMKRPLVHVDGSVGVR